MLALFAAQSIDKTILPSTVLTIVSAVASFSYIILHSIVARRQNRLQQGVTSRKFENACYVAIRLAVTLCILWLLTSGWNFIVAARQPVCLPQSFSSDLGDRWRVGSSCAAERFSAAISFLALVASCTLFGILAIARRPFEASLLGFSPSALTTENEIHHRPLKHSRKLAHAEDGVYNPALHRVVDISTSTLTSLTSPSFHRPDTAMTERTTTTSILNLGGIAGMSQPSTPGPSFPPTPSTGDAIIGARQNNRHFAWDHSPPPLPPLPARPGTNTTRLDPPLPPLPLLLPAAPIVSSSATIVARRISSAESKYTPPRPPSLASPYSQRRSRSYGQALPLLQSPIAGGSPVAAHSPPSSFSPTPRPPRLLPARPARSPPPLDSAWRAMHPNPPGVTVVVGGRTAAAASAPAGWAGGMMELNVPKVRARASAPPAAMRARPPSMPHSSPHPRQMMSWLTSSAAATTTTTTAPTSLSGWTPKTAMTQGRRSIGGYSSDAGESLALTTAALARLTAEQLAHQQQLTDWHRQNGSVAGSAGVGIRRGRGGHGIGHRRIPTPSGPPPSMPISVRPVVSDGTPGTASFTPSAGAAPATPSSTTTAYRTSNNNNANAVGGAAATTTTAGGVDGRPSTPINQMLPHHHNHNNSGNPAPLSSAAILSLQHRAARQRPLRWPTARRSLSSDDARCYSSGSSSTIGTNRSSSCGTSSPLSTTMVRASEVDAEVLREEMEAAAKKRRETFGSVDEEQEEDEDNDGAEGKRRLDVVEQISGVEKSGRWCRVRRGFGVVGGARKGGKKGALVAEREEGDLGIEGRNWVRNASGEQSLAGSSEGDGNVDGVEQRGREDSGVECEIRVTESSERGSSYGSSEQTEPEQLVVPRKRALLPSWTNGVVARKSPEQSLLDAVLEASKVSPLLQQQQLQELGGATSVGLTPVPGDDSMVPVGGLSRSETVIRRRTRSVEGERKRGPNSPAEGGITNKKPALGVGLGLNCVIGVGTGADNNRIHGQQGKEVESPGIQRTPRTRRKTVALG
ncbi:uncharacterized protein LTHEOB_3695 [Lasiodiplodia theobromae]|uniref:uncharacterized protein n=1 Tax=Lasiodiplodia theobromae TaxID=45133 RepID=UPI0015C3024C|nr:uncharacterized protein LTHEOB_3695 [Lasiodiplodia theobromae]KAF4534082.1 hypothetical protein LTHEOB_3695 [Lasiodiplodia theobromae]